MGNKSTIVIGSFCVLILVALWSAFWTSLSLAYTWDWFVATKFGLPTMSIFDAFGLSLIAATFKSKVVDSDAANKLAESAFISPLVSLVVLGVGSIVKVWV